MLRKIAVLADIHGNLTALNAVLADAQRAHVTEHWFLGDLFLPGPGAEDLYEALAAVHPQAWLQGNWEEGIHAVVAGKGHWDDPSEVYFGRLTQYLITRLDPAHYQALIKRPIAATVNVNGLNFGLTHNQPERSTGHDLYPAAAQTNFDHLADQHDVAVYGHTHQQLMRVSTDGQLIINPGAVGQPYSPYKKFLADQRAHYAILTVNDAGQLTCDFRKVAYAIDDELAVARKKNVPYFEQYEHLRRTGLTITHDQQLLARVNAAAGYVNAVRDFFEHD